MVGVGVVGCGYWGPKLIRCLSATPGFRMAAACDAREGRRLYVAQRHPGLAVEADVEALLARGDVEAVWVATPARSHYAIARRALESGRHVLVEKPLSTSAAEAADLVELAEQRGLTLQAGHTFLFSPAVGLLRGLLASGGVGPPRYVTSERINPAPPSADAGVLWDLAVHDVSILIDLIGGRPSTVTARALSRRADGLVEAAHLALDFDGGVAASVHVSWMSAQKTRVMKLFARDASLIYDDDVTAAVRLIGPAADNRKSDGGSAVDLAYGPPVVREFRPEGPEPLRAECEAFLAGIRAGEPAPNDGRRALDVVRVLEAAEGRA